MNGQEDKRDANRLKFDLLDYQSRVDARLEHWKEINFSKRLWDKDPTLWFPEPAHVPEVIDRLGWLTLPETKHEKLDELVSFGEEVKAEGISNVILLGMGGSSLAPEVFQKTFNNALGYPRLRVLDSTHPDAVLSLSKKIDLPNTLFLVSSKSGTTLETLSLFHYFWDKVSQVSESPGNHFAAITDSGTPLMKLAKERGFRTVFEAPQDVGGRYSALSVFGLVPAALIGIDIHRLLDRVRMASKECASSVSEEKACGLRLGAALGEIAASRDKLTFLTSPELSHFPDWLEQLIAESTGKDGKGIVPVANEPLSSVDLYGDDRMFLGLFLEGDKNENLEDMIRIFQASGHPTIRIYLADKFDLGKEMFYWEVAVASAGSVLEIHAFNQPDVQLAKELTRKAMEKKQDEDRGNSHVATVAVEDTEIFAGSLEDLSKQANKGDFIAIQAYLSPNPETTAALQKVRLNLLGKTKLATTLGYGPRFLHSTGQLHKGGPNSGLFVQFIDEPKSALPVPETNYTFGELIRAQALGDYRALKQKGRRVIRINLKDDVIGGLHRIDKIIKA